MKIKNFEQLAISPERKIALDVVEEGLRSIDTRTVIHKSIQRFGNKIVIGGEEITIQEEMRVFLVSIGKCGLEAAQEIEKIIGDIIYKGVVIDIHEGTIKHPSIRLYVGDHPFPSERNIFGTKMIIDMLSETKERDVVIAVISGGGSSLLCQPENMTCFEESDVVERLFRSGAPIEKVNTVRKHLSLAKGGYLAKHAYPANVISLIFSDVPGDAIEFVASGPTVLDSTTIDDAKAVLNEYGIIEKCPFSVKGLIETPKDAEIFKRVKNVVVASNAIALRAMQGAASAKGFSSSIRTSTFSGHARHIGAGVVSDLEITPPNTFLLYGGESTVVVKGKGKGGRNQEVVLSALRFAKENDIIVAIASDGHDNTEFAGGICDIITKKNAVEKNLDVLDYLNDNNSFEFFRSTGDYIETGITGSNVSDLILGIRFKK